MFQSSIYPYIVVICVFLGFKTTFFTFSILFEVESAARKDLQPLPNSFSAVMKLRLELMMPVPA